MFCFFFLIKAKARRVGGQGTKYVNSSNWKVGCIGLADRGTLAHYFHSQGSRLHPTSLAIPTETKLSNKVCFWYISKHRAVVASVSLEIFKSSLDFGGDGLFVVFEGCCMNQVILWGLCCQFCGFTSSRLGKCSFGFNQFGWSEVIAIEEDVEELE